MTQIAVVGAGIAGLNAALTLQDAGLSCTIYEASHRIGGRIHSDAMTWADGMVSEWCGEFIDADHETIHQLIKRFGLRTIDLGVCHHGPGYLDALRRFPWSNRLKWVACRLYEWTPRSCICATDGLFHHC
jgi:monoamine oxidase